MTALERLGEHTYEVRHNPNCPSPFCVVTCGDAATIERHQPRNLYSYGKTLDEAASNALKAIERRRSERNAEFESMVRESYRRAAESKVCGVVWA